MSVPAGGRDGGIAEHTVNSAPAPRGNGPTQWPIDPRITAPARLAALRATGLLDGGSNAVLDRLTRLVTRLLGMPVALVSQVSLDAAQVKLGTWEWHIPSGELLCNPPLSDVLGLQAHEFEPGIDSWERRLHPDDQEMVRQALSATRDGSADE